MLSHIVIIIKKELNDYFSSLAAFLFLAIFLTATYIVFFWVEAFFARNLADMRAFFNWIPILLIFLVSVLTMSAWSEERRLGTIELQLTSSVPISHFILGKFFSVMLLIAIALLLTLPLAVTVDVLGDLDWGPVIGGYIAALFLAAAYTAIGLWASAQSDNQIVGLILSIFIAALFYVIGTSTFTQLFGYEIAEWLRAFATGARFESITRGVLDARDILYYLTIVVLFFLLNKIKLESLRSVGNIKQNSYWLRYGNFTITLVVLLLINITISYVSQARIDFTQGKIYTLSSTTKDYLKSLEKPLLIRGYFSSSTHPLLAPLAPRMRDLLYEYAVASQGNVRVEIIDPLEETDFEEEAVAKYGIRPVSFHVESKYKAAVINTYFNVLVEYGDQYDVLNYKQMVELKSSAGGHEVELKNPEYQLTRTIKSVVYKEDRQVVDLTNIQDPLVLSAYVSEQARLPRSYRDLYDQLQQVVVDLKNESNDNFDMIPINPDQDQLTEAYLSDELRLKPNFIDTQEPFWFDFTLTDGRTTVPVILSNADNKANQEAIKQTIFAAYKKLLPDSIKTVAILRPLPNPGPFGVSESPAIPKRFSILRQHLRESFKVIDVDLRSGQVNEGVDLLLVLAPRYLNPVQVDGIDKFLRQGGTVVVSSSSIDVAISQFAEVYEVRSGLEDWLGEFGINIGESLVLDMRHGKLSLPTLRRAGSRNVRENYVVDYPYVIDVRDDGLNIDNSISAKLGQVFVPWSSPIRVDLNSNQNRKVTPLLSSSKNSWLSKDKQVLADYEEFPELGFNKPGGSKETYTLATMIEGPFAGSNNSIQEGRLVVVGSSMLFTDNFADQMSQVLRTEYRRPMQFVQNIVDWSLEDQGLLQVLRKHTQFTRTLSTISEADKTFWEYLNYILGLIGLTVVGLVNWLMKVSTRKYNQQLLTKIK